MPKLKAKGTNEFVESTLARHKYVVPVMMKSYMEAVEGLLHLTNSTESESNEKQLVKGYVALRNIRDDVTRQLDEIDVGLDFIQAKLMGIDNGDS